MVSPPLRFRLKNQATKKVATVLGQLTLHQCGTQVLGCGICRRAARNLGIRMQVRQYILGYSNKNMGLTPNMARPTRTPLVNDEF